MLGAKALLIACCEFLIAASQSVLEWHDDSGPWVIPTNGEPWPLPATRYLDTRAQRLDKNIQFQIEQETCDILEDAVTRYRNIVNNEFNVVKKIGRIERPQGDQPIICEKNLSTLTIRLKGACDRYPTLSSDESYHVILSCSSSNGIVSADTIWGILRGLETFSQLLAHADDGENVIVQSQWIQDKPRLAHRGLLLDTSRHYLPVEDILRTLDGMAYNKLNVLHWHIVDDNSFPYVSEVYPELSGKGAYHPTMVYNATDIARVIEYARLRGIRVMPEFDTPGHTKSWGLSHPEFLTPCYDGTGKPTGKLGPMNPATPSVYSYLQPLLAEISSRFPDKYVHLGGDEVPYDCWRSNPEINSFMRKNNMSQRYDKLEELYVQRVLDIVAELKVKPVVWQEVFDNGVHMHEGTVVQVWTGNWRGEMAAITAAGHPVLLSACWYLDHVASGGDWLKYYNCDPMDFRPTPEQANLVLGGEACMWGEFVDRTNVHSRIWPRASAAAERLWSRDRQEQKEASKRLEEHACRMNRRGIPAQPPNGSGFCIV